MTSLAESSDDPDGDVGDDESHRNHELPPHRKFYNRCKGVIGRYENDGYDVIVCYARACRSWLEADVVRFV